MEYEDILMRNQELMAIINRLTIERDELVTKTYKLEKERDDAREQEERFSDDALRLMHERNNALRERDEARREVCRDEAYRPSSSPPCTANQVANRRGWDCFKQEDKP
jgi:hypothetical protein